MAADLERVLKRLRLGRPVLTEGVTLVHARVQDHPVTFCTDMENDPIQRNHRRGRFYEHQELAALAEVFAPGGTFVDIGANVGNHTLYAALVLGAGRVIPFEPNPRAWRLLVANVQVNGLGGVVELSRLGVGLSDRAAGGYAVEQKARNLGSVRMLPGEGEIEVKTGDALLAGESPALIKIDVEGMEMQVLRGLAKTLATHRPVLLVEVDNDNAPAFRDWAAAAGYRIEHTTQRYRTNRNHLLLPEGQPAAMPAGA